MTFVCLFGFSLQPGNGGVVMVNFYSDYIYCNKSDPSDKYNVTLQHVAGV